MPTTWADVFRKPAEGEWLSGSEGLARHENFLHGGVLLDADIRLQFMQAIVSIRDYAGSGETAFAHE
jgi:hypothetical protein